MIGSSGGLLWTRQWTCMFHKRLWISRLAERPLTSQGLCSIMATVWRGTYQETTLATLSLKMECTDRYDYELRNCLPFTFPNSESVRTQKVGHLLDTKPYRLTALICTESQGSLSPGWRWPELETKQRSCRAEVRMSGVCFTVALCFDTEMLAPQQSLKERYSEFSNSTGSERQFASAQCSGTKGPF
jgi:hypothetical protein